MAVTARNRPSHGPQGTLHKQCGLRFRTRQRRKRVGRLTIGMTAKQRTGQMPHGFHRAVRRSRLPASVRVGLRPRHRSPNPATTTQRKGNPKRTKNHTGSFTKGAREPSEKKETVRLEPKSCSARRHNLFPCFLPLETSCAGRTWRTRVDTPTHRLSSG